MKKIIKYIDKPLFITTVLLFIMGLIMVFSASNVTAYMSHAVSPYNYFFKQGIFLLIGFVMFLIMIKFNTKSYGIFSWGLLLISIASLVILLLIGTAKNRAISWFDLGFFSIQPSEFVKVITIVFLANYYDTNSKRLNTWGGSLFPIGICAIVAGLIFIQPDLGTTIIYCAIVGIIFISVPIQKEIKYKTAFGIIGLIAFGALVLFGSGKGVLLERQLQRFDFSNPCEKILDTGNQVCNCYIIIDGYPGKSVVMARRHGDKWYIAGVTASKEGQTFELSLPMLSKGDVVTVYSDGKDREPQMKQMKISNPGKVKVTALADGGFVIVK